jgi:hypothetical protein
MVLCRRHKTINFHSMFILILLNVVDNLCCVGDARTRCTACGIKDNFITSWFIVVNCGVLLSSRD